MENEMARRDLVWDHPPLAAAGINTANPHYDLTGQGSVIREGDIIQLDLWAKEPGAVYADISWAGVYGKKAGPEAEKTFADLVEVREAVLVFIEEAGGRALTGAEVDAYCRSLLCAGGYGGAIKHRTGHGIDTEVHGSGVNIDSVEFPDHRRLLEGSCFSLEPGIYLSQYGFRTEIDVYIAGGRPRVSGLPADQGAEKQGRQSALLCC
jgi:Xaa-Pro aminopeptidase